ncbi:hypothetical protein ATCC90586_004021 [Pythium insidiosum]|nr:hypothetical protein ATCC90586_004021 [Pythium insidiosum]
MEMRGDAVGRRVSVNESESETTTTSGGAGAGHEAIDCGIGGVPRGLDVAETRTTAQRNQQGGASESETATAVSGGIESEKETRTRSESESASPCFLSLMEALLELLQALVASSTDTASVVLNPSPTSTSGMQICLQLLTDPSPWIRGPTVTLVKVLQDAQPSLFAASVLECKEGLRRLLELVEDKREHIRDTALQVLAKLTEKEKNVQQFLAFEDGFVRLFQIMETEGLADGSSVVADCLQIVNNMVRDNLMTQTLFRELAHLVSHVPRLLSLPVGEADAPTTDNASGSTKFVQKKRSVKLALQLIRFLVANLYEGVPDAKLDEIALRDRAKKSAEMDKIQSFLARQSDLMGAIALVEMLNDGKDDGNDFADKKQPAVA